ncbi:hypothetical protein GCM10009717_30300 [Agromyces allii]|uniref:Uncharacterized protein n=1 Tax=Agromyces allii TaxID=393607 RepID=A0ABN2R0J8_9MICO
MTDPSPDSSLPALHPARAPTASAAAALMAVNLPMRRLFIIEPLESFGLNAESDLDVGTLAARGYAVKSNKSREPRPPAPGGNIELLPWSTDSEPSTACIVETSRNSWPSRTARGRSRAPV